MGICQCRHTCIYLHIILNIWICMWVKINLYMHTCICICICTCTCIDACTCICICRYVFRWTIHTVCIKRCVYLYMMWIYVYTDFSCQHIHLIFPERWAPQKFDQKGKHPHKARPFQAILDYNTIRKGHQTNNKANIQKTCIFWRITPQFCPKANTSVGFS